MNQSQTYIKALREQLKPGDTIYTVVEHVSRSGMMRHIRLITLHVDSHHNAEPWYLSYQAAKALDWPLGGEGIKVVGSGMDMGFHTVYELSRALFDDGYALKQRWL